MSAEPDIEPGSSRVHIFGQTLTIKGAAEDDYLQSLAAFVTAHMERLSKESPLTPMPQVAMLAALNIAHELFSLRDQADVREAALDNRTRDLLKSIEEQVQPVPPKA